MTFLSTGLLGWAEASICYSQTGSIGSIDPYCDRGLVYASVRKQASPHELIPAAFPSYDDTMVRFMDHYAISANSVTGIK